MLNLYIKHGRGGLSRNRVVGQRSGRVVPKHTENEPLLLLHVDVPTCPSSPYRIGRLRHYFVFIPPDRLKSMLSMYRTCGGLAVVAIE